MSKTSKAVDLIGAGAPALADGLFYRVEHVADGVLRVTVRKAWLFWSRLVKGTEALVIPAESALEAVGEAAQRAHAALKALETVAAVQGDHAAKAAAAVPEIPAGAPHVATLPVTPQ
jgi:hypothetical protein